MTFPTRMRRALLTRIGFGLGAVLAAAVTVLAAPTVAHAHGTTGIMAIDVRPDRAPTPGGGPGELTVQVRITHADDGDPALGAVATVTASEAGGAVTAPVTLTEAGDGTYTGAVPVPSHGSWTVRVDSTDPVASAEKTVAVTPTTATTPRTATTRARSEGSTSSNDGDTTTVVVAAIAVVVVAAGLTVWLVARSRRRT